MTGTKEGLTGHFLRSNPHLVNTHCSAHRLALCSEQAAEKIPAMKYYQGILESLFYHFKKSPVKCDAIEAVQKLLDEPKIKYREVHQIRWLSFYQALDAVHRTLDSLLTYFSTATDAKAQGMKKKMGEDFFLQVTYAMMDILQPVMQLNLFFQRKDVDIGCVQICVDTCIKALAALVDGSSTKAHFQKQLKTDVFKGHHIIKKSKYSFTAAKQDFIQAIIDNITKRFPDKQLMTSMCVLGLRPITLLSQEDAEKWGNDGIQVLVDHFGSEQVHQFTATDTKEKCSTKSPAVIDGPATIEEWRNVKQVVRIQAYPRQTTSELWGLIKQYHTDQFPNLLKLAALALAHPVHTSDCERAFSAQNHVTVPLRNRPEHCAQMMRIMIEGPPLEKFEFMSALHEWRIAKSRAIFKHS